MRKKIQDSPVSLVEDHGALWCAVLPQGSTTNLWGAQHRGSSPSSLLAELLAVNLGMGWSPGPGTENTLIYLHTLFCPQGNDVRIILGQFDQNMAAKVFCCVSEAPSGL